MVNWQSKARTSNCYLFAVYMPDYGGKKVIAVSANLPPISDNRPVIAAYVRRNILPRWGNLLLILIKNVVGSLLYMLPPFMSKIILDTVLPKGNWNLLLIVVFCTVAAPIVGSVMIILEVMWGRFMVQLSSRGRADLYNGIQYQPYAWTSRRQIGDLLARMLDDTRRLTDQAGQAGFALLLTVSVAVGAGILITFQPVLGAVVLTLWVGQSGLMSFLASAVKRNSAEAASRSSVVAEKVREIVSASMFIKASGMEAKALERVRGCLHEEWKVMRKGLLIDHRVGLLNGGWDACNFVAMYAVGGWFVLNYQMTIGSLVAFVAVYNWVRPFGVQLITMALAWIKALPSIDRVVEIAFSVTETAAGRIPAEPVGMEARQVTFRYGDRKVLDNVSIRVGAGTVVSIVGSRGSGKSTLADLLLGLREPESGDIRIGGIPLQQVDRNWLRRNVLCVTQDVMLRNGTMLDNILFGAEAAEEEVREAARLAQLEEWVRGLPNGWDTEVGEQAWQISGGERQRISIARALLRKPAVLIFDEATSALDQETERRLLDSLFQYSRDRGAALVFITHRLDVAAQSDEVWVMSEGKFVERGTPEELLRGASAYRELWSAQYWGGLV
jgi:ABC-type multidrug transport system fused ATPase/permease subunit